MKTKSMVFFVECDGVEYAVYFKMYGNDSVVPPVFSGWDVTVALSPGDGPLPDDPAGVEFWFAQRHYPQGGDAKTFLRLALPTLAAHENDR